MPPALDRPFDSVPRPGRRPVAGAVLVGAVLVGAVLVGAVLATLLLAAVLGTGPTQPLDDPVGAVPADSFLRLEQEGCYGTCPQYTVRVCGDGTVRYVGERFVNVTGPVEYRISGERVRDLFALANRTGFFDLEDSYEDDVVDDRTARMAVDTGDRTHRVTFEPDVRPERLGRLVEAMDALAHPYANATGAESGEFDGDAGNATC